MQLRILAIFVLIVAAAGAKLAPTPGIDPIAPAGYDGVAVINPLSIEQQTQQAGLIVVGRVTGRTSRAVSGGIVTDVTVSVEQPIKGPSAPSSGSPGGPGGGGPGGVPTPVPSTLKVTVGGGQVGNRALFVGGVPNFVNGERVLLFLRSANEPRLLQVYNSKYTLAGSEAVKPEAKEKLPITQVESRMASALNAPVKIGASGNMPVQVAPFTAYCQPWQVSQYPIPFRVNDANPGPGAVTGLQHFSIAYRAWATWQRLPDSAMAFRLLGGSNKDGNDHGDGESTVAWNDLSTHPNGGPGVIGLNFCSQDHTGRTEADTLILNTTWTWDSNPDDGINGGALSLYALLLHELGHGIGLGHSDATCDGTINTPVMCPAIQTGQDKTTTSDDIAGARSVAPLAGGVAAPGAPTGLLVTNTGTSNSLAWTAAAGSKFAHEIERATGSCTAPFSSINTVPGTTVQYVDNNYGFGVPAGTTFCYRVRALGVGGDSGYSNTATPGSGTPECAGTTTSLWAASTTPGTPAHPDTNSYELGVKFRSDVTGTVCGVRFYKGTGNTGLHVGKLWTTGGALLASGTFTNETATGWQTLMFSTGVVIQPNTTYIVSYSAPVGRFGWDAGYFNSQYDSGVLHAPSNAASGGNGVWAAGAGNFPGGSGGGTNYWVDVVFAGGGQGPPSGGCTGATKTVFAAQSQPATPAHSDQSAYTLGVKFTSEVAGRVCGVRFYKGAGNTGTHTGHLWNQQGQQLASVTFSNETASGWQQANFATPVQITANTIYIISYSAPNGRFAFNAGQLSSNGVDNPPLHIPSSPSSNGNALVGIGVNTFPNLVSAGNNFWVDVVFQATQQLCGSTTTTVFAPNSVPAIAAYPDPNPYEVGVKFTSDVAGQVCGVRFYKGSGNTGTHTGHLWNSSGALLSSATFTGETATGWQQALFPTPIQITANTTYVISYSAPNGRFALNQGQLNSSIDNVPLHLPSNGASGGNAVVSTAPNTFPTLVSAGNNFWVDVLFAPGSSSGGLPTSCAVGSSSVFLSTATPGTPAHPDPNAYELGMKFRADVNGTACGVRFYKGTGNNGTHTGRLWTSGGQLLASVAFTGETATGWQQALFSTPVALTANTTYVVSYTDPQGRFSYDANFFANTINNGPLHAPSNASSGGNGVAGAPGTFPSGSANGANFWVDILFAPTCPCSIWNSAYVPTTTAHPDTNSYELGMKFRADQNGFITGVRFYKGLGNTGTHTGRLWRVDGTQLASAVFTNETATGWQQVSFATPVFVSAGETYIASYSDPFGRFAWDPNYFTAAIDSGPLHAFSNAPPGGQGLYNSMGAFPGFSANGTNFWVDPVFVASCLSCLVVSNPATAGPPPALGPPPFPPPGSATGPSQGPSGSLPPGSQQIKPPTGDTSPPIPQPGGGAPQPAPAPPTGSGPSGPSQIKPPTGPGG